MNTKKKLLDKAAVVKTRELNALIDTLNNTTIGTINDDISMLNKKIDALSSVFGLVFNADGTLASEAYSTHTHKYEDDTIADTSDGTGETTTTTKTTQGVS